MWLTVTMPDPRPLTARPADALPDSLVLPRGRLLYESLTTRFVVFHRVVSGLAGVGHTGYLRYLAEGVNAIVLLRSGRVVDCRARVGKGVLTDLEALQEIERRVDAGEGTLDVIELDPEVVDGLHLLASGIEIQPELRSSWVRLEGFVDYLDEIEFSGSLTVQAVGGTGAILFDRGQVIAAYSGDSITEEDGLRSFLQLCQDGLARLSLRGAAGPGIAEGSPVAKAVADVLSRSRPLPQQPD